LRNPSLIGQGFDGYRFAPPILRDRPAWHPGFRCAPSGLRFRAARRANHPPSIRQSLAPKIFRLPEFRIYRIYAHPGPPGGAIVRRRDSRGWACGGRGSVGRERMRAGQVAPCEPVAARGRTALMARLASMFAAACTGLQNPAATGELAYGETVWS
jgi:hypothetical protein